MFEIHRMPTEEDRITMVMHENENILCIASAKITDNVAEIEFIDEIVPDVAFIMSKAILNSIDLAGYKNVITKLSDYDKLLRMLKFTESNGIYSLNLEGYFTASCGGECGN